MTHARGLSRRDALRAALPLAGPWSTDAASTSATSRTLVAYVSRTGNTRVVAGLIRRAHGVDLVEIEPADPYPEDYQATVDQATRERATGYQPPLRARVAGIDGYDVLFLGFPIWGMSVPPVIRSFLGAHDLTGKRIVPFFTHGGYGLGTSLEVVAAHAPRSRLLDGFAMQADQERRTRDQVTGWLDGLHLDP